VNQLNNNRISVSVELKYLKNKFHDKTDEIKRRLDDII